MCYFGISSDTAVKNQIYLWYIGLPALQKPKYKTNSLVFDAEDNGYTKHIFGIVCDSSRKNQTLIIHQFLKIINSSSFESAVVRGTIKHLYTIGNVGGIL